VRRGPRRVRDNCGSRQRPPRWNRIGRAGIDGTEDGRVASSRLDIDADALKTAAEHARLNNLSDRLQLVLGGPGVLDGGWPLVVANVLAAPLIEMTPVLIRRVGSGGRLVLSGIPWFLESEVRQTYQRPGMRHIRSETRAGWAVVVAQASW
jgi:ribosomal protein L11 methyltransferase